jgi:hypothetical protein
MADAIWTDEDNAQFAVSERASPRLQVQRSRQQKTPRSDTEVNGQGGLLNRLAASGFEAAALTECISSGGTDLLFDALGDLKGPSAALVRAELVGLLLVLVAQGFPQASGREQELLLELQSTLAGLYQAAEWVRVEDSEQFRELPLRLCEGCVCFTTHGAFKRSLCEAPDTLQAILRFMCEADLSQGSFAFVVVSFLFNLCRGRDDLEYFGGTAEMLHSGLRKDSLLGLLYSDVLAAADPGPPEVATFFRALLCTPSAPGASAPAATILSRCAESCASTHYLIVLIFRMLCLEPENRLALAASGGIQTLVKLADASHEALHSNVRQILAQVCITTDPGLVAPDDQLRAVDHLVQLMQQKNEQLQLDGAMGLTNLLTIGDEVRTLALQCGAWAVCQELLFSESEGVRRAATEAMCNFTAAAEVVEFCACGQGDLELQVFTSFCAAPDHGTQVAATGALAMLARCPEVALRIASGARCQRLLEVLESTADPDIQHRVVSCLTGIFYAPDVPSDVLRLIHIAFLDKQASGGFVSKEAEALVRSALEQEN